MVGELVGGDDEAEGVEDMFKARFGLSREPEESISFFLGDIRLNNMDLALFLPEFKELLAKEGGKGSHQN